MVDVLIDSLKDSLIILGVLIIANIIIAFLESKINNTLEKSKKWSPLLGGLFGLVPQCGFSVVSTDLYLKKHISVGTLLAVYIATSDEAIPILLSHPSKYLDLLILLLIKIVVAIIAGYLIDFILHKRLEAIKKHNHECHHHEEIHVGCCHHEIEDESKIHRYLLHPLIHSLKTFIYCFIITFLFGTLIYYVGEENINSFISSNIFLAPLFSVLVGLIPNCAASLLISNLYCLGAINFGSLVAGLIASAGLGLMVLIKDRENIKGNIRIILTLIGISLLVGYGITFIEMFI